MSTLFTAEVAIHPTNVGGNSKCHVSMAGGIRRVSHATTSEFRGWHKSDFIQLLNPESREDGFSLQ